MAKIKTRLTFSAGGVVFRQGTGGLEIVLAKYDDVWGLPKGTPEGRETKEQTAIREVAEETGLEVEESVFVGSLPDEYGARAEPTLNLCFRVGVKAGTARAASDVEALKWFSLDDLPDEMAFNHEFEMLEWAKAQPANSPSREKEDRPAKKS